MPASLTLPLRNTKYFDVLADICAPPCHREHQPPTAHRMGSAPGSRPFKDMAGPRSQTASGCLRARAFGAAPRRRSTIRTWPWQWQCAPHPLPLCWRPAGPSSRLPIRLLFLAFPFVSTWHPLVLYFVLDYSTHTSNITQHTGRNNKNSRRGEPDFESSRQFAI